MELHRVAEQVLEHRKNGRLVTPDLRKLLDLHIDRSEQAHHSTGDRASVYPCAGRVCAQELRIVQQVVDQGAHPASSVHDVVEVAGAALVERVVIALLQQLHEACHRAERLRQVVGSDVRKLLQIPVGASQRLVVLLKDAVSVGQLGAQLNPVTHVLNAGGQTDDGTVCTTQRGDRQ